MNEKPSVLKDTDDEARRLARRLLHSAPHVALAVIEPDTGFPFASRVLCATDGQGAPFILVSALSAHTKALTADPRCSLLTGEQGKGDPLAYPRLTLQARAERIDADDPRRGHLRRRFVLRHPKAELYVDFPDFAFFRLEVDHASLNGGFGRAYALGAKDILIPQDDAQAFAAFEEEALETLSTQMPEAAAGIAKRLSLPSSPGWRVSGLDAWGVNIAAGDNRTGGRLEFPEPLRSVKGLMRYIAERSGTIR